MNDFYISTIDENAGTLASKYGLGIEIADFCTAWNMDERLAETDAQVQKMVCGITKRVLHGPFSELFPCAIDPKIRAVAKERYQQAVALAKQYGATKVIIHGGYNERLYFPCWFVEQSILFWKDFLTEVPEVEIVLENVLEPKPEMLVEILEAVNHPNLKMCLDIGHANAYSSIPLQDWLNTCGPYISHFHIHNNDGTQDAHSPLTEGTIHMRSFLMNAQSTCPNASFTLELMDAEASVQWLVKEKIIEMPELVSKGDTL